MHSYMLHTVKVIRQLECVAGTVDIFGINIGGLQMIRKKSNSKNDIWCDYCKYQVMRDNFCYRSFFYIYGDCVCRECAKSFPDRCPVCGEMKGNCQHKEADDGKDE